MLEKVITILSEIVVSNTVITIYKEKPLPLGTRKYSSSVKRKQRKKKITMVSDKLSFPFLVETFSSPILPCMNAVVRHLQSSKKVSIPVS